MVEASKIVVDNALCFDYFYSQFYRQ